MPAQRISLVQPDDNPLAELTKNPGQDAMLEKIRKTDEIPSNSFNWPRPDPWNTYLEENPGLASWLKAYPDQSQKPKEYPSK